MEDSEVLRILKGHKRAIDRALETVSELEKATIGDPVDVAVARAQLRKLRQAVAASSMLQGQSDLQSWMQRMVQRTDAVAEEAKAKFGADLEAELRCRGLSLGGHYPTFKTGFFTIEANVDKASVVLWYGPKQEHTGDGPMRAGDVAEGIEKAREALGSGLPPGELLAKVEDACRRTPESAEGRPVPIGKVLSNMAHALQGRSFHENPTQQNYHGYSRADFSYDLYRLRSAVLDPGPGGRLALSVASREETRDRSGFLWVPEDEHGKGTTYSHVRFERPR